MVGRYMGMRNLTTQAVRKQLHMVTTRRRVQQGISRSTSTIGLVAVVPASIGTAYILTQGGRFRERVRVKPVCFIE